MLTEMDVHVSGLCVVRVKDPEKWDRRKQRGPERVGGVELLMANAKGRSEHCPRHRPCLSYYLEDNLAPLAPAGGLDLMASPEGKEVVSVDLTDRTVQFLMPYPYSKENPFAKLTWRARGTDRWPSSARESHYMDWALDAAELGLKYDDIDLDKAIARVELPNGTWLARCDRNRNPPPLNGWLQPTRWRVGSRKKPQAVARSFVLRFRKLRSSPRIRILNARNDTVHDVLLTPGEDNKVNVSFTNLPLKFRGVHDAHVSAFGSLSRSGASIQGLELHDDLTTGGGDPCSGSISLR